MNSPGLTLCVTSGSSVYDIRMWQCRSEKNLLFLSLSKHKYWRLINKPHVLVRYRICIREDQHSFVEAWIKEKLKIFSLYFAMYFITFLFNLFCFPFHWLLLFLSLNLRYWSLHWTNRQAKMKKIETFVWNEVKCLWFKYKKKRKAEWGGSGDDNREDWRWSIKIY